VFRYILYAAGALLLIKYFSMLVLVVRYDVDMLKVMPGMGILLLSGMFVTGYAGSRIREIKLQKATIEIIMKANNH